MDNLVRACVARYYGVEAESVAFLGGGFYGRVYLAQMPLEPFQVVCKIYLYDHMAEKEALQLTELSRHGTLPMPQVYFLHRKDTSIHRDALLMQYTPGITFSAITDLTPEQSDHIAQEIVENLLAYHRIPHAGFGEIGGSVFYDDFRDWYRLLAADYMKSGQTLFHQGLLDPDNYQVLCEAWEAFDAIFSLPITEARLVHGDYNGWNYLIRPDYTGVSSIIDPFDACWGDPEMDLPHLREEHLALYAQRAPLTPNFALKRHFYSLFSNVRHYHDAQVHPSPEFLWNIADPLQREMVRAGILPEGALIACRALKPAP